MKRYIAILAILTAALPLSAQQRLYPLEKLDWLNPYLGGGNMSALTLNCSFLGGDRAALSEAAAGMDYASGEFRNVYDPESEITGKINIESYSKIKKAYLYGRFGFSYNSARHNTWRGSAQPYRSPFMLADSIPGDVTRELYTMEAGVGVPVGRVSLGLDVAYDVAVMAKLKDLRNRNTDMTFRISPGITYNGKRFNVGLNAGYERSTEKVEYTQIADNKENYLFYLYGLWIFNNYGYSSAETSRLSRYDTFYGNLQFDLTPGRWRIYNDFGLSLCNGEQTESGYNNLRYGDTKSFTISDRLTVQHSLRHRFRASVSSTGMDGFRYLQRQELDPSSGIRRWVTYGDAHKCYNRRSLEAYAEYTYRKAVSSTDIRWEVTAGASEVTGYHTYSAYPLTFLQKITAVEPYVNFSKYFKIGQNSRLEISPRFSYVFTSECEPDEITVVDGVELSQSGDMQLSAPLMQEFNFWADRKVKAGLGAAFDWRKVVVKAGYGFTRGVESGLCRHNVSVSVGLAF